MAHASSSDRNNSGQSTTPDRAIAALARKQHGVIARAQLSELDVDGDAIDYRVSIGRLHVLQRGVYAVGHKQVSWFGELMAAVMASGPGAVVSHRTAADLWGIRKTSSRRIEVTSTRRIRRPGILPHQRDSQTMSV